MLSPLLFILYTSDIPPPGPGTTDIMFADDNMQVVTYPGKGKEGLARRTVQEIKRINDFERKWKIKSNQDKFQLLTISALKPHNVIIDGNQINFTNKAKVLGLTLTTRGLSSHIKERKVNASRQMVKLRRFKKLTAERKIALYKTMIRPLLEYPAVPICTTSKSNIKKL